MKNFKRIICVLLAIVMAGSVLTACSKKMTYEGSELAAGKIGEPYNQSVAAAKGPTEVSYALKSSGALLPKGLTLSAAGVVSGTPTEIVANRAFTVVATAKGYKAAEAEFILTIGEGTITYGTGTTVTLAAAKVGDTYSASVAGATAAGEPVILYEVKSGGNLPKGLGLNKNTGAITGVPETAETRTFTITASAADYKTAEANFTIVVAQPSISLSGKSLSAATANVPYNASIGPATASYGNPEFTYTITAGGSAFEDAGFSLNTATGAVTGTPKATEPQGFTLDFTVSVTASGYAPASAEFSISVSVLPVLFEGGTLANGKTGIQYNGNVATATVAAGEADIAYTLKSSSTLPAGLKLDDEGTGAITGRPTEAVTNHKFTIVASAPNYTSKEAEFTISITTPGISYTGVALAAGEVDSVYSASVRTAGLPEGGSGNITYTITNGQAAFTAAGFTFANGVIGGTPAAAGEFVITVRASAQYYESASAVFTITVAPIITFVGNDLTAKVNVLYDGSVADAEVKGLVSPPTVTYTLKTGTMPNGLIFTNGAITGTPTAVAASVSFTVTASAEGCRTVDAEFTIQITDLDTISLTGRTLAPAQLTVQYVGDILTASAPGNPTFTYTVTTGLQNFTNAGFILNSETGAISGTPTGAPRTVTFAVRVTAAEPGYQPATANFSIVISYRGTLSYTGGALPAGRVGDTYSGGDIGTATASNGSPVITYLVTDGNLPSGLTLSAAAGQITGAPGSGSSGQYTFIVTARAEGFADASAEFTLLINNRGAITITTTTLPDASLGQGYNQKIAVTAPGSPAVAYEVTSGLLNFTDAGFTLNAATGVISGTPTGTSRTVTFTVTVTATDYTPASRQFTINIVYIGNIVYGGGSITSLEKADQGEAYSANVATATGAASITYAITAGEAAFTALGLTFNNGIIGGTPNASGTLYFTVTASAANYRPASAQFSLVVEPPTVVVPIKYTFEAEHVSLRPKSGVYYSASANNEDLIAIDGAKRQQNASNGYSVGHMYQSWIFIEFVIWSDRDADNVRLDARLSAQYREIYIAPTNRIVGGRNYWSYTFAVNKNLTDIEDFMLDYQAGDPLLDGILDYDPIALTWAEGGGVPGQMQYPMRPFTNHLISMNVSLKAGRNSILLIASNNHMFDSTVSAEAPMVDCLYLTTTANLKWDDTSEANWVRREDVHSSEWDTAWGEVVSRAVWNESKARDGE